MKLAVLTNHQPYLCTLPHPLAGVLAPGEVITTRYSTARLSFLLGLGAPLDKDVGRALVVSSGPDSADTDESRISSKSPPRDYFAGYAKTVGATSAPIAWRAEGAPLFVPATAFAPNSVAFGVLSIAANAADGTNYATYQRSVRLVIGPNQTIVASDVQVVGTDVETQAGANVTLTVGASGLSVSVLGVAGETYRWTASYDVQAYTLGG